ncbi:type III restriction enzyme, res subunit [Leptospira kirschneri str. 200803703]|uniref:DEAD/DEAH box helicase n=1 Tax=Leptospira kirschneri TaxID=29507 RepID=UPI0002BD6B33|nr:DEAD/DEAH box helicase family protein [Leptospira kirschneri]EMO68648.1 type III restriction enzyme, res subunit [Leptospira kirschneri str. 200803703]
MKKDLFRTLTPNIENNLKLRLPQRESFNAISQFLQMGEHERELAVIMPVACGKSGCITLAPFAFKSKRTLIVAPNISIAVQLFKTFDFGNVKHFYKKFDVLNGNTFPEPVEIRGLETNKSDLDVADVVITNIHQLQGAENRWLKSLPNDFFDLILFDEGHHSAAESWHILKFKFPNAYVVNFSATHMRADHQMMPGKVIYQFSIADAIRNGFVKHVKAIVLNPKSLKFFNFDTGKDVEIGLDEIIKLGKTEPKFRRSIVSSAESINTIVDVSIRELERIRRETSNPNLKIIAVALNYKHCKQIVEAYRSKGKRCDFVHSNEHASKNRIVHDQLENHELDVIVQVKKLGEGFDHPYLSVAVVFSIFLSLAPFIQFIGRIMRAIVQNSPYHPMNQGTVIFHAGANLHNRWNDLREFSQSEQEFFSELFPTENEDFSDRDEIEITPSASQLESVIDLEDTGSLKVSQDNQGSYEGNSKFSSTAKDNEIESDDELGLSFLKSCNFLITEQSGLSTETLTLLKDDKEITDSINCLIKKGISGDQLKQMLDSMVQEDAIPKFRKRQNSRENLRKRVEETVEELLIQENLSLDGYELDSKHHSKTNTMILQSVINSKINFLVNRKAGMRREYSQSEFDLIETHFEEIVCSVKKEFSIEN